MNIIKRARNLWALSSYEPHTGQQLKVGDKISTLYKPNQPVEIIKKVAPIDTFLENNGTK